MTEQCLFEGVFLKRIGETVLNNLLVNYKQMELKYKIIEMLNEKGLRLIHPQLKQMLIQIEKDMLEKLQKKDTL